MTKYRDKIEFLELVNIAIAIVAYFAATLGYLPWDQATAVIALMAVTTGGQR